MTPCTKLRRVHTFAFEVDAGSDDVGELALYGVVVGDQQVGFLGIGFLHGIQKFQGELGVFVLVDCGCISGTPGCFFVAGNGGVIELKDFCQIAVGQLPPTAIGPGS